MGCVGVCGVGARQVTCPWSEDGQKPCHVPLVDGRMLGFAASGSIDRMSHGGTGAVLYMMWTLGVDV